MKPLIALFRAGLVLALLTLTAGHAAAQTQVSPPTQITYQGFLTDANGAPFGSNSPVVKTLNFRLYTAALSGVSVWSSQQYVTVDKGYFSVLLGQGGAIGSEPFSSDLSSYFTTNSTLYLETQLADSSPVVTLAPRLQFQSAPYSFLSKVANQVGSEGSTTFKASNGGGGYTLNGSLTANSASVSGAVTAASATVSGAVTAASFTGYGTIPIGGIIMWSGSLTNVPAGWALCNGTTVSGKVTPNLQDKFIVGAGNSYAVSSSGGATTATLTASMIPDHKHKFKDTVFGENSLGGGTASTGPESLGTGYDSGNTYVGSKSGWDEDNNLSWVYRTTYYARSGTANPSTTTDPVNIMPPYYALAYIMRVQ
ncbi:MAG: Synechococcus phage [Verrucomicrobiota bacterium]